MADGFQDIIWLAGRVFIARGFVAEADEKGLDAVFSQCPYGDLTAEQKAAFKAAFSNAELRKIVEHWWATYDEIREAEGITTPSYWEP